MLRFIINFFVALMIGVIGIGVYQQAVKKPIALYYGADISHSSTDYSYKPGQQGTHYDFYLNKNGESEKLSTMTLLFIPAILYFSFITLIGILRRVLIPNKIHFDQRANDGRGSFIKKKTKEERSFKNYTLPLIAFILSSLLFLSGYLGWWRL